MPEKPLASPADRMGEADPLLPAPGAEAPHGLLPGSINGGTDPFRQLGHFPTSPCRGRGNGINGDERVQRARVADERQQLGEDGDHQRAVVAEVEVGRDMPADLWVAAAVGGEDAERQEFALGQVEAAASVGVAEADSREVALDVHLVPGALA